MAAFDLVDILICQHCWRLFYHLDEGLMAV